jgi:hypothetical protein
LKASKSSVGKIKQSELPTVVLNQLKFSIGINKNTILSNYQESCVAKGINNQVSTIVNGENSFKTLHPSHHCLIPPSVR